MADVEQANFVSLSLTSEATHVRPGSSPRHSVRPKPLITTNEAGRITSLTNDCHGNLPDVEDPLRYLTTMTYTANRGGIPEAVDDGGIVLPLPERLSPLTRTVPEADEVAPWVEAIIRLWDDAEHYQGLGERALQEAQRWRPDRLRSLYAEFFRNVRHQPGAPVPNAAAKFGEGGASREPREVEQHND